MFNTPEFMAKVLDAYGIDFTENKIMCPFHGDINPSMSVDLAKSRVYCFGCQKSYDAIKFIEAAEPGLNMLQVYKRMAEINNGNKIELKPQHVRNNSDDDFEQFRLQAADYYYNLPKVDWNEEWTDELDYMVDRGFTPKLLNACGAKINYNANYPIIFPMIDNGKFMGWVGRTMSPQMEAKRKYLYNKGFRRALTLCGRYERNKPVILVEGYMDMLKIRQQGVKNVAALLGWKITEEQIQKLRDKNITEIVSAVDNDECGIKGDNILRTLKFKQVIRWMFRENQKDPGDQSQSDIKRVLKYLKKYIDI